MPIVAYGYGTIWIWRPIDDCYPKNIDWISLWWPNQTDILRISTLLTGLRCGLLELNDHRCCQDRWRNRAALHAIGNPPPSAQPDCLRQRTIHPQQAAARAEALLNPLSRQQAGDRPTMTPTASAKGEGRSTPGHPPLCASATQIRATITTKSPSAVFTAYASSLARLSLAIGRRKAPPCRHQCCCRPQRAFAPSRGEGRAIASIPKIASVRFIWVPLVQLSGFGFVKLMLVCRLPAGDRCKSIIRLVRRVKTIGRTTVS